MKSPEARLAVLEANYTSIDRRAIEHEDRDEQRFERTFSFIKDRTGEILDRFGDMDDKFTEKFADIEKKVDSLWDDKQQRTGAFKMSKVLSHFITGMLAVGTFFGVERFFK